MASSGVNANRTNATHVVGIDDTTYYAIRTRTGEVVSTDADAAVVINAAINDAGENAHVLLSSGKYVVDSAILINRRTTLEGSGGGATTTFATGPSIVAPCTNFADTYMIKLQPSTGLTDTHWQLGQLKHLCLYGNKSNQTGSPGAVLQEAGAACDQRFEDIWFDSWKGYSIELRQYYNHHIIGCTFEHNEDVGIVTNTTLAGEPHGSVVRDCYSTTRGLFKNTGTSYPNRWWFVDNYMQCPGYTAIDLTQTVWAKVLGNAFYTCDVGVLMPDTAHYPNISHNSFHVVTTVVSGVGNPTYPPIIESNSGYATTKSGTSTGTGAQQTIAHGLAAAPTRVLLSESTTGGALAYQSAAADATNIYITATNTKTYQWEAKVV